MRQMKGGCSLKQKKKLGDTLTKIFRSELLNYKILSIPFVKHSHGVT